VDRGIFENGTESGSLGTEERQWRPGEARVGYPRGVPQKLKQIVKFVYNF